MRGRHYLFPPVTRSPQPPSSCPVTSATMARRRGTGTKGAKAEEVWPYLRASFFTQGQVEGSAGAANAKLISSLHLPPGARPL